MDDGVAICNAAKRVEAYEDGLSRCTPSVAKQAADPLQGAELSMRTLAVIDQHLASIAKDKHPERS